MKNFFRKHYKTKKALVISLVFIFVFQWIFTGWPTYLDNIFFSNKTKDASAFTAEIRPDGDNATSWSVTGSTCSGGHWCTIDENPENTTDYISQQSNQTQTDDFTMSTISGITSATEVQVHLYTSKDNTRGGYIDVNLNINGINQTSQRITPNDNSSYGWESVTFSGLNMNQSDLDSLRVTITSGRTGGGPPETIYVSNLYASVTYTLPVPDLEQIHYRWRNDDGIESALTWYDSNWVYRKKITIDSDQVSGSSDLTNFPVLIKTTDSDWRDTGNGGNVGISNGDDIVFTDSDGTTLLDYEIEYYDNTTGELVAWVKVPTLDYDNDTSIYIYYGNATASNQEDAAGVWDSNYEIVWHLDDASSPSQDSTSNNNDGAWGGAKTSADLVAGKISYGSDFDGVDSDSISDSNFSFPTNKTISFWYNRDNTVGNWSTLFENYGTNDDLWLGFGDGGDIDEIEIWSDGAQRWNSDPLGLDTWYYFAYTSDATNARVYINGVDESGSFTRYADTPTGFALGDVNDEEFDGIIDEFRFSNTAKNADWISTEYANQNSPSSFYSVGGETAYSTAATWSTNEDTPITGIIKGSTERLRFEISNESGGATSTVYQLEVSGANPANCSAATYTRVNSSLDWDMSSSVYFSDGDPTYNISLGLTDENTNFVSGELKDNNDQTSEITLDNTQFTEIEYAIEATNNATDGATYCFRLTNGGSTDNITYNQYAQATLSGTPPVEDLSQAHYRWRNDDGGESAPTDWYNSNWGYRKKITIDNTQVSGASDLTNFPVLINRTDADWRDTSNGGHVEQADGDDIVFTDGDGTTVLDYEIEYYDNTTGELVAWVEIPTLDYNNDTSLYMYYGNASASNQEDAAGVWDSNYVMVQHLEEAGTGARDDSTSYGNDGTPSGYEGDETTTGQIDGADDLDGANDYIDFGNSTSISFDASENYTYSVWFKADDDSFSYWPNVIGDENDTSSNGFGFYWEAGNLRLYENAGNADVVETSGLNIDTWYQGVFTYSNGNVELFINGNSVDTGSDTFYDSTGNFIAGVYKGDGTYYNGEIDEIKVSNIVRSDDWIATEYNNQSSPSTFYSINNEEVYSSTGASWAADEDTKIYNLEKNNIRRVRFEISNEGDTTEDSSYQIQVAETSTCSTGSYSAVSTGASGHWQIVDSTYITDGEATFNISPGLTDESTTFVSGELKDADNTTSIITLEEDEFTEIEFAVQATDNATDGGNYCFRLYDTNQSSELDTYSKYAQAHIAGGNDFKIQRDCFQMNGTTETITAGVDYDAPASTNNAFIRITNTQSTGAGDDSNGGSQNADDVTTYITNGNSLTNNITFERFGSTNNTHVCWEIVEYIGEAGGSNEFIVHNQDYSTYGSNSTTLGSGAISGVSDDNDIVPFITGQANPDTGRNDYNTVLSTAFWNGANNEIEFTRGESGGDAVRVSWAAVEFTGDNWKIQRSEHTYTNDGVTETETITPVNDLSKAFLHIQKRANNLPGLDEFGHEVWLSTDDTVSFEIESGSSNPNNQTSVAWIIENTQTDGTPMVVTRSNGTQSGGNEPSTVNVNIGKTLSDLSIASIFTNNRCTGTGTAFPRPIMGVTLLSTSQYQLWISDTGQTRTYRTEVVEWPTSIRTEEQSGYRFFENTNSTDVGSPLEALNTAATAPVQGTPFRLRALLHVYGRSLTSTNDAFKLQFAEKSGTCDTSFTGETYTDVEGSTAIAFYNNPSPSDGDAATANANDPTHSGHTVVTQRYEEANNFTARTAVAPGRDGLWDFSLVDYSANSGVSYCFRIVKSDGSLLDTYSYIPEVITSGGASELSLSGYGFYENNNSTIVSSALAATNTPAFLTSLNEEFKLRLLLHASSTAFSVGAQNLKLQFSPKVDECDTAFAGEIYTDVTSTSSIAYYNNLLPNDGDAVTLNPLLDPKHENHTVIGQSYEELNPFTTNAVIPTGQDGLWEFSLIASSTDSFSSYCFRVVKSDDSLINEYLFIPEITSAKIYNADGYYISNWFDTGSSSVFNVIEWDWSKTDPGCTDCEIKLRIQTAPDTGGVPGAPQTTWCGPEGDDGDDTDYFTVSEGELIHTDHNGDQWIRYRADFTGDISNSPILEQVEFYYLPY